MSERTWPDQEYRAIQRDNEQQRAEIERLRAEIGLLKDRIDGHHRMFEPMRAEIEQLRADKAVISQTASDYLHEIEQSYAVLFRLSEDVAFSPMRSSDMDEIKARLKFVREAPALKRAREILGA
jgi:chromosome segregation ATPase